MDQNTNKVTLPEPTNNYKKERVSNWQTYAAVAVIIIGVVTGFFLVTRRSDIIAFIGIEYQASEEETLAVNEQEVNGFSFAFGTEPSDPIDYTQYELPTANESLEAQYYEALQTSPAFEWIDNVNEILEYDDFDKDGNVKEEAMRDIIEIARETEEQL